MNGKQHSAINLTSAIVVSGLYATTNSTSPLVVALGILYSIIASPDCDVDSGSINLYFFRKVFGRLGSSYWQHLWKPYARNFAHRGISHTPVIGTLIRFVYIILPTSMYLLPRELDSAKFIQVLFAQLLAIPFTMMFVYFCVMFSYQLFLFLIGIIVGDIVHIVCDHLSTGWKRKQKNVIQYFKVNRQKSYRK